MLTRSAYSIPVEMSSVGGWVGLFTLSTMNISETSRPNSTKFYLKHHLSGGLIALGFRLDRIGTLATNSSHRVIMGKL